MGGGGVKISWLYMLTPPPPPLIFKKDILQWNTVTTKLHLSEHLHITYNTIPWLTFFINWWGGGGGGQNIMVQYFDPPTSNIQERYFDIGIQCHLSFITQNM